MTRSLRIVASTAALVLWVLAFMPQARAGDPCPVTDLSCDTGAVGATVGQVAGTVGQTAGLVVQEGASALHDALVSVRTTVHGVTHPSPGGGTGQPVGGRDGGGAGPGAGRGTSPAGRHHPVGGVIPTASSGGTASPAIFQGLASVAPADRHEPSTRSQIVRAVEEAAAGAALLGVVLLLVVGFVAVQDRIDRRDPRLAPASFGSDRVAFG